jgi:ATP-dependent DNA ligase
MTIKHSSPILESKTRTGSAKFWQGHYGVVGSKAYTQTSYWQVNKEGEKSKVQFSMPYEAKPKNVGRANETTAEDQAKSEFESMVKKQMDKGYAPVGTKSTVRDLPMLAQKFKDKKKKVEYPVLVQPKYDGNRMLHDGTDFWSRGGKDMVAECVAHLVFDTDGHTVDGELILPGNVPLEETSQALKAYKPGISENLLYRVYDLMIDAPYAERLKQLKEIVKKAGNKQIIVAPTFTAKDEAEVMKYHKQLVKEGYEGIMVRWGNDGYNIGHRSPSLLKYKDFIDAEFKIVEVREGEGSDKGQAKFVCVTKEGNEFEAKPEGSVESKREIWKNRKDYIGKWLTVRYQTITKKNRVPQFPVGVTVREDGEF